MEMGNITQKWVEILKPFSSNYAIKFTASGVSRKTKISQQTVPRILNKLSLLNILNYEKKNNKKFIEDYFKKNMGVATPTY